MVTNDEHNKYISWAFIAHASFQLLITLVMLAFFMFAFLNMPTRPGDGAPRFMLVMMTLVALFQTLFIAPSFIAAYALRNKKPWARLAAIIAGIVSAVNVPLGTAACVYAMWFFFGESWKDVYAGPDAELTERQQLVTEMEARWSGMRTDEKGEVRFHQVDPPDWR